MGFWEIFWLVNVILALVSFTILSVYVLIKGYGESKIMFSALEKGREESEETE
jgi:hypothetical protein